MPYRFHGSISDQYSLLQTYSILVVSLTSSFLALLQATSILYFNLVSMKVLLVRVKKDDPVCAVSVYWMKGHFMIGVFQISVVPWG